MVWLQAAWTCCFISIRPSLSVCFANKRRLPYMCVYAHKLHNTRNMSLTRCLCVSLHELNIVSEFLCSLDSPQLLPFSFPQINLLYSGRWARAYVTDYQSCPWCLPEGDGGAHCELPAFLQLEQRDRRACPNALCFCHSGQAFGYLPIYYSALMWSYYTTQHFCLTPIST